MPTRGKRARVIFHALGFPLVLGLGWVVGLIWFRMGVRGRRRFPRRGPALVVCNHRSYLDPFFVRMVTGRRMGYLMTYEWYNSPWMRWFYDFVGCIPVGGDPRGGDPLERAERELQTGEVLVIFPEGGVDENGCMQRFRRGAAVLALRTGVPLVPVFTAGSHEALPKSAVFPRPRKVTMLVGEPFRVGKFPFPEIPRAEVERVTHQMQERVASLGRSLLGDVPATRAPGPAVSPVPQ